MYLSRVELNQYRRETMVALNSPEMMHAAVMASFNATDPRDRVLWRLDSLDSILYLLVQSGSKPDFHHIIDQFGRPDTDQTWDTLEYDGFLSKVDAGQVWRFRLKANPVHSIVNPEDPKGRGKVVAHITPERQIGWILDRSPKNGFEIVSIDGDPQISVVNSKVVKFSRQKKTVTISMVTFEGFLKVTDKDVFVKSLIEGIGRAKAYGCGMMTIARP